MKLAGLDKTTQQQVLEMLESFGEEGHSGASAHYTLAVLRPRTKVDRVFKKLASFTALTPLTGKPSEWMHVAGKTYQSKRCPTVFKQAGRAYNLDDKPVYIEPSGATYTSSDDVPPTIKFPYDVAAAKKRISLRKPKRVKE